MIFYIIILILAILLDIKEIKSGSREDKIFFSVSILLVLILGIAYFSVGQKTGIAEYVIEILNLEGV